MKLNSRTNDDIIRLATYCSVGTAFVIIIAKFIGWVVTDSLSIMASLIDSLLDIVASVINLIAVRYSLQPPDHEHRFGHGKAEDLAVFSQSVFFNLSAAFLFVSAIKRVIAPKMVQESNVGIALMAFSLFMTILLVIFQHYTIKRTQSTIIAADKLHYLTDLLSNFATLMSLYLGNLFATNYMDPVFAIIISLLIFKGAFDLLNKAFKNLMDHEFDDNERAKIISIIMSNPGTIEFHDLKTRYSGNKPFIQFHLELDPNLTLLQAHDIVSEIEKKIHSYKKKAEIMIRQDPAGLRDHIKDYKD